MRAKRIYGTSNNVLKPKSEEEIKDLLNTSDNKKEIFKRAVENGLSSIVEILLKDGADPNTRDDDQWPLIVCASLNRQHNIVELLLKYGADPNIKTPYGKTAIEYISRDIDYKQRRYYIKIIDLLKKYGAI